MQSEVVMLAMFDTMFEMFKRALKVPDTYKSFRSKTFVKGSSVRRPHLQSYACFNKFFLNPRDATRPWRTALKEPTVLSIRCSFDAF